MIQSYIEPGVPLWIFWLFIGSGVLIQGISKSGFAGGVGVLSLPLMMLVMPVEKVVATLLPLLVALDINAIWHHRRNKNTPRVLEIWLPSIVGIAIGSLLWFRMGEAGIERYAVHLKRFVGVIAVLFGLYIVGRERAMKWTARLKPSRPAAICTGLLAGFTSTLCHGAGPIVSLYIFTHGMGKTLFVGTVAWIFFLINASKLPTYFAVGLIDLEILKFDLLLLWLVPIGSWTGKWMHDRVSEKLFNRVICALTLLAGIQAAANVNFVLAAVRAFGG